MKFKFLKKIKEIIPHEVLVKIVSNSVYAFLHTAELYWKHKMINYDETKSPAIYAMWHGTQWGLGFFEFQNVEKRKNINILISLSKDGDFITRICELLGFSVVRGSTNKHGESALREMITLLKCGQDVAFMVDGPRGPKQKVKPGLIRLAKLSGAPIIPIMPYTKSKICMKSWDDYQIPTNVFMKATMLCGEPIYVPAEIEKENEQEYIKKVEDALLELNKDIVIEHKHYWGE